MSNPTTLDEAVEAAFKLFRHPDGDTRALSTDVALAVGAWAARWEVPIEEVTSWLQGAYSRYWVRLNYLNPGMDLAEVKQLIEKAYNFPTSRKKGEEQGTPRA